MTCRKRRTITDNIKHNGQRINWQPTIKYLGITVDRRLTWNAHITNRIKEANKRFATLYCVFGRKSKLSLKNKLKIYKTIIRPVLTYAPAPWCFAAKTHLQSIESTQNKFLRMITNSPWFIRNIDMRVDLQIQTIIDFIKTAAINKSNRLYNQQWILTASSEARHGWKHLRQKVRGL